MSKKEMVRELLVQLEEDPGLCAKLGIAMDDVSRVKKLLDETELSDDDLKNVSGGTSNQELLRLQQITSDYSNMTQMITNIQKALSEQLKSIIQNLR